MTYFFKEFTYVHIRMRDSIIIFLETPRINQISTFKLGFLLYKLTLI